MLTADQVRCGDLVFHRPSREMWVVAWAEGEDIAWAGWPNGIARLTDCLLVYRATAAEHAKAVDVWRAVADHPFTRADSRCARVLRLYGTPRHLTRDEQVVSVRILP